MIKSPKGTQWLCVSGLGQQVDTELLRTFLEVRKTRHFARAADNLFITQAAVSARIRQLEEVVGQRLLTRERNNIQLTAAGHLLVPHAESILATLSRALLEAAGEDRQPLILLGCLPSLREIYLDEWLSTLLEAHGDWRLQLESLSTLEIITRVRERSLDLGIVYDAPRAPDLWVEAIASFNLELVAATPGLAAGSDLENYVQVDWGTSLSAAQEAGLSGLTVRARLDSAVLARNLVLALGGCALLPRPLITGDLNSGTLFPVEGGPVRRREVFVVGAGERGDDPVVSELIDGLRARLNPIS